LWGGGLLLLAMGCDRAGKPAAEGAKDDVGPTTAVSSAAPSTAELLPNLFRDVAAELGVDFVHHASDREHMYFMPRSSGSGGAFLDYDGDGRLDLYLIQNDGPDSQYTNRLYRQTDSGFVDVSQASGLDLAGFGMGVACGDVNNDGRVDVLLNEYNNARLLLNQTTDATPRFVDITASSGLENPMWGTSACMFDYDRDGWLDLVLVNYLTYDASRWCADGRSRQEFCGPDAFAGRVTKLYHNLGQAGSVRFHDVTVPSGFGSQPGPGYGVFCADFDGDHWPDVFIANDGKPNHLWINQQDGTFKEQAVTRGLAYNSMGTSEADMGVAVGDVDSDGMFDIFATHLATETHTLWRQGPRGIFVDRTATSGFTAAKWRSTGFGTVMVDVDNDGDNDLLLANGGVTRNAGPQGELAPWVDEFWGEYAQRDQILLNRGTGSFVDASLANEAMCGLAAVSRGLAAGDFNNDGRLDMLVTHIAGPVRLLQNVDASGGHWLLVRAVDPELKRDAYGAEVYVQAGSRRWMRWINPGYSYLCSNDPRAHFGLGSVDQLDAIRVIWPDGGEETFAGGAVDREVTLRRGEGTSGT
jgi:hypothetical protein